MSLEEIRETLIQKGLKATHQRMVVYQELMKYEGHPSAEEIYEKVRVNSPSISLGTIYKTLETFVENELSVKVSTPAGKMKYDATIDNHNHIYCTNTDEIYDFRDEELNQLIQKFINKKRINNFEIKDVRLHIRGNKIDPTKEIKVK